MRILSVFLCIFSVCAQLDAQGRITTVSGTGTAGYSGDAGPASSAQLTAPGGVAVFPPGTDTIGPAVNLGTLYIADTGNHRIRKVDLNTGVITTFAGTGAAGFSGDGGQAIAAQFNAPTAVAVDPGGKLYVADTGNHRIRVIDAAGTVTTLAGNGTMGFSGDGGTATSASLSSPSGLSIVPQYVNVADTGNHRIRRVNLATGVITTFTGTGSPGYNGDRLPVATAQVNSPRGLLGSLVFADTGNQRIRTFLAGEETILTVVGTGEAGIGFDGSPSTLFPLSQPADVEACGGTYYLADSGNHRIVRWAVGAAATTIAGRAGTAGYSGDGGLSTKSRMNAPVAIACGPGDRLYVADAGNHAVRVLELGNVTGEIPSSAEVQVAAGYSMRLTFNAEAGQQVAFRATGSDAAASYLHVELSLLDPTGTLIVRSSGSDSDGNWVYLPSSGAVNLQHPGQYSLLVSVRGVAGQVSSVRMWRSGGSCGPEVRPSAGQHTQAGSTYGVTIVVPPGCTAPLSASANWVRFEPPVLSPGVNGLLIRADPNLTAAARQFSVNIGSGVISFWQPLVSGCVMSLSAQRKDVGDVQTTYELTASPSRPDCAWHLTSDPWIVPSASSGTGDMRITVKVLPNFSSGQRIGGIGFTTAGAVHQVFQAANTRTLMQRYVQLLYYSFFGRLPSVPEMDFQANSGLGRADLAWNFFNSQEFNLGGRFVGGAYVGLLDRDAEFTGWLHQREFLLQQAHMTLTSNFLNSAEYKLKFGNPSDEEFIRLLYRKILFREPAPEELQAQVAWLVLRSSRPEIALSFLFSAEFRTGAGARVNSALLYFTFLQRDPSPAERQWLTGVIQSGAPGLQSIVSSFANSPEINLLLN